MADAISAVRRAYRELVDGTLRVQFDIEPMYKKDFLSLFPDVDMVAAIAPLQENVSRGTLPQVDFGRYYQHLYQSRFLLQDEVLQHLGTDDAYRAWIQKQHCIVCQKQDWVEELGEGRCEAAHVRRADKFGTAYKASFSCVPLCHQHHGLQHLKGESVIGGVDFVYKQRNKFLREWAWERLHQLHNVESLTLIEPDQFYQWAQDQGIEKWLP